ncbi:Phosphoglycerol transferase MdoB [Thiocapsa roseopersicina]|uniref:Phosphoglycerol transferase MdoB n=2 Tax=Thiocapsa roseopersicina TaxID=1058 RepID=A0A1H2ZW93_THIRO|nr:Phosphoglycerol transferase MdoB [Thiocapsa roseopersicina]
MIRVPMNRLRFPTPRSSGLRRALGWTGAMLFVAAWYLAAQAAMDLLFEVKPGPDAFRADLIAHLVIGALLYGMSSSLARFALGTAALFTALTLGNALKMSILGGPLMPDDFVAAKNMFLLLEGWQLAGAALMVAVPAILLWWMIAWRRAWSWVNVGGIALAVALLVTFPEPASLALDKQLGNSVWNQRGNFESRGLPLQLLQEGVRSRARREPAPTPDEVEAAIARLGTSARSDLIKVASPAGPKRNLHMIVLESFWDPMLLGASKLSADPLDPAFRELWAASGHAHALAPVFGGYTANTEFEILCGFPVERDNVFFEGGLRNDVPCLPRHLASAGYRSFASHPNAASFWNRVNAYRRIGFDTYWSDSDFALDDMNEGFLSDASLYRQVLERLGTEIQGPTPIFNYVLTYFGHLPYPLNAQRQNVVGAAEGHATVEAYANTMYYKSRELMDFLHELRQRDPDSLIVLFGDHLPALGNQFGGFRESGLLAPNRAEFSDTMFRTLVATPLILIDGRRGVVKTGDLPFYQLPGLLLRLLEDQRPSMMALTAPEPGSPAIRPLPGMHFIGDGDTVTTCRDPADQSAACTSSTARLAALRVIGRDIFGGAQHALRRLEPTPGFRAAASALPPDELKPKL